MPHFLTIEFAAPVAVGGVTVVLPTMEKDESGPVRIGSRIAELEIQAATEGGAYHTVWAGRGSAPRPIASGPRGLALGLRRFE